MLVEDKQPKKRRRRGTPHVVQSNVAPGRWAAPRLCAVCLCASTSSKQISYSLRSKTYRPRYIPKVVCTTLQAKQEQGLGKRPKYKCGRQSDRRRTERPTKLSSHQQRTNGDQTPPRTIRSIRPSSIRGHQGLPTAWVDCRHLSARRDQA